MNASSAIVETEKQERAFTLGLAGLLGEGVYNFGELVSVSHPKHQRFTPALERAVLFTVDYSLCPAYAPCTGDSEKHRQTVADRHPLCLQWRQC